MSHSGNAQNLPWLCCWLCGWAATGNSTRVQRSLGSLSATSQISAPSKQQTSGVWQIGASISRRVSLVTISHCFLLMRTLGSALSFWMPLSLRTLSCRSFTSNVAPQPVCTSQRCEVQRDACATPCGRNRMALSSFWVVQCQQCALQAVTTVLVPSTAASPGWLRIAS